MRPTGEAAIQVLIRGDKGQEIQVEAVIDTGFNGFLTLPVELIPDLELQFVGTTNAALGDGKQVYFDVYEATVVWDGKERNVAALATDGGALVGTSLLWGHTVTLTMEAGGAVRIEALP